MSTVQKHKEFLKKVNIFSEATDEVLEQLACTVEELNIDANTCIFKKGDVQDGMYLIVNGEVKVHDGDYVFNLLHNYDFFGEYSLIDSDVRSASVSTTKETVLLRINQETIGDILQNKIQLNHSILKSLIKRLRENNILEEKLVQQKEEIEAQRKELKELNATKDKFFAILAHDLRNPISTIIGMVDILKDNYDALNDDKKKEYIYALEKYSGNVIELLNDLLKWGASTSGIMKFEPTTLNLKSLFIKEFNTLIDIAQDKKIELDFNAPKDITVLADKNTLITILRNIIGNALKFTSPGGRVEVLASEQYSQVKISIVDSGIGMSKEDLEILFKIEEDSSKIGLKENTKLVKSNKGSGLGLILCKEFVNKNNGQIDVKSKLGVGTEFIIKLPKA